MRIFFKILLCFSIIFLSGCSAKKRFAHLVKNHPELVHQIDQDLRIHDTIPYHDTFYYPGFTDTFTVKVTVHDTTIVRDNYTLKIKTDQYGDKHYNLNVLPDTFYKKDTIYQDKIIKVPGKVIDNTPEWLNVLMNSGIIILVILLAVGGLIAFIRR